MANAKTDMNVINHMEILNMSIIDEISSRNNVQTSNAITTTVLTSIFT